MTMSDIELQRVNASYGDVAALVDVDLRVEPGSLTALLGPSGCGKSTTVRVIAGFHRVDSGTVRIAGRVVDGDGHRVRPEKRRVGVVPQDVALFPNIDVGGNVGYGIRRWGHYDRKRVERLLEMVGLPGTADLDVHQLSGGQQQRVALARALAPEPVAVMLDEPFSALDASLRQSVRADVRRALRATGTTAVLVTHDQEEALSLCDRVAVMREGRVVATGTPDEVYEQPDSLWTARFVGDVVELPVLAGEPGSATVTTALGPIPAAAWRLDTSVPTTEDVAGGRIAIACVRPEHIRLARVGVAEEDTGRSARVTGVTYYGHDAMVEAVLPDGLRVRSRVGGGQQPREGDRVEVSVTGTARVFHRSAR